MKSIHACITALALAVILIGCGRSTEPGQTGHDHAGHDDATDTPSAPIAHAADVEQTVQVGCAGCIYEQDWAEGCQTAVKIGDQVLLLKGVSYNAHKNGLCKAEKTARVTGHAEADHFAATQIEIQP